ncbi:DNA-3-methyladenine glycosylase [Rhizobium sp. RU20A]|uniref:DNA-3-methyladenine glycosylase family protein n=1 Tax=Rhizobium sp. RU20A TaxID=1907412 RepID=UPI00122C5EE3|nr:DNA-3-methyladenine glycosylase [Rhizobium sp. RU20A]
MRPIETEGDIAAGLTALGGLDPRLVPIIAATGPVPLRRGPPGFAGLAEVIVGQMVSKASAAAIWARLAPPAQDLTPEVMAGLDDVACRAAGLSHAKARALRGAAAACLSGALDLQAVGHLPGESAIATLTALPGIGAWTAEVYLLVHVGHPDIFPAGDVALRAALGRAFCLDPRPDIAATRAQSALWAPFRSVAARLFWAYYARHGGIAAGEGAAAGGQA